MKRNRLLAIVGAGVLAMGVVGVALAEELNSGQVGKTLGEIVEKLTRTGNEILYEVTVHDPESFVEPWVMTPRVLRLNPGGDAGLIPERANCEVFETEDITNQLRH